MQGSQGLFVPVEIKLVSQGVGAEQELEKAQEAVSLVKLVMIQDIGLDKVRDIEPL